MKKHLVGQCQNHKNLIRLDFIRSINPVVAEKLKLILQQHKDKERDK